MTTLTYLRPAALDRKVNETRIDQIRMDFTRPDIVKPLADGVRQENRLNMGPAILLAAALSTGFWALIIGVAFKIFH